MFRRVAIINVGNKLDPLIHEVESLYKEHGPELLVVLAYGRPFPGQVNDPMEVAQKVAGKVEELGGSVKKNEISNPEDLDVCISEYRELADELWRSGIREIIVDFTEGTKVMSAALVHVILKTWGGSVEFRYVGGRVRDKSGMVVSSAMEIRRRRKTLIYERMGEALKYAGNFDYHRALAVLGEGDFRGKVYFVCYALKFLYFWDSFRCDKAGMLADEPAKLAKAFIDEEEVESLAETIMRLSGLSRRLSHAVKVLVRIEAGQASPAKMKDKEGFFLLALDALEDAKRRVFEKRFADVVLRSYRATEIAVQAILMCKYRFNPWKPSRSALEVKALNKIKRIFGGLENFSKQLALFDGLTIIEALEGEVLKEKVMKIATIRNHSYLEHGYQITSKKAADMAVAESEQILNNIAALLGISEEQVKALKAMLVRRI